MDPTPSEEFLRPYRQALKRYGPGFEATLWSSRDTQVLRFDVMIELAGFEGCTVLDVATSPRACWSAACLLSAASGWMR